VRLDPRVIHTGDCLDVMAAMEPESVDAIVTDPPYGLEFMGKEWDRLWTEQGGKTWAWGNHGGLKAPAYKAGIAAQQWHQQWAEAAYRVAKPSAYLLAFGGTRTVHRMTVALEDAGWIIRDMLVWGYASGFPKSKASLKPAWEPIVMARKPGPLRMLAIDECRLPVSAEDADTWVNGGGYLRPGSLADHSSPADFKQGIERNAGANPSKGRWPANLMLTDPIFDGGIEGVVGGGKSVTGGQVPGHYESRSAFGGGQLNADYHDSGTYSRFFLIPKADRSDREPVLGGLSGIESRQQQASIHADPDAAWAHKNPNHPRRNGHPTVKPTDLMRHLVRLVTPTGGTVLDPFLGSGTTALAAEMEGYQWVGIERELEYVRIAEARLNGTQRGMAL
jgi:site-specific DNA-methyltransferase (adenine-specific)